MVQGRGILRSNLKLVLGNLLNLVGLIKSLQVLNLVIQIKRTRKVTDTQKLSLFLVSKMSKSEFCDFFSKFSQKAFNLLQKILFWNYRVLGVGFRVRDSRSSFSDKPNLVLMNFTLYHSTLSLQPLVPEISFLNSLLYVVISSYPLEILPCHRNYPI